jgi:hypothetical protein
MSDDAWYTAVAVLMSAILVLGLLTGLGLGGAFSGPAAPAAPPSSSAPDYLYFTVTTSAATSYDTYYPANVTVPAGVPIVITITSYDPGVNVVNAPYTHVIGTVGGTANYSLGLDHTASTLSALPPDDVSHTFSVTYPGSAGQALIGAGKPIMSVPVPVSPDGVRPSTVTFTVIFPAAADYVWTCVAPCDPYSMQTPGFMIGAIYVT